MRAINADAYITAMLYDDEHEEFKEERMTIEEYLDSYTTEGCPSSIKTIKVKYFDEDEKVWKIGKVIVDEACHEVRCDTCQYRDDVKAWNRGICDNCDCGSNYKPCI